MRELLQSIVWQTQLPGLVRLASTFLLLILALVYNFQVRGDLQYAKVNSATQMSVIEEARYSKGLLSVHIGEYLRLQKLGYIGQPRNLQWIEHLRKLAEQLKIPAIRFELGGSRAVSSGDAYYRDDVAMRITSMKIDLILAHEGDFYRLFNRLRAGAAGLFSIDSCELDWRPADTSSDPLTRLQGSCELSWYTLVDVTETWQGSAGG